MAATSRGDASTGTQEGEGGKTYFEEQREGLCREIAMSLEDVLQNINKLNRSLEGVIAVGNEFSSVEALWSQFENVMAPNAMAMAQREGSEEGVEGEEENEPVEGRKAQRES